MNYKIGYSQGIYFHSYTFQAPSNVIAREVFKDWRHSQVGMTDFSLSIVDSSNRFSNVLEMIY